MGTASSPPSPRCPKPTRVARTAPRRSPTRSDALEVVLLTYAKDGRDLPADMPATGDVVRVTPSAQVVAKAFLHRGLSRIRTDAGCAGRDGSARARTRCAECSIPITARSACARRRHARTRQAFRDHGRTGRLTQSRYCPSLGLGRWRRAAAPRRRMLRAGSCPRRRPPIAKAITR